MARREW